jgi:hypothetical protein
VVTATFTNFMDDYTPYGQIMRTLEFKEAAPGTTPWAGW